MEASVELVCTANAEGYFTALNGEWERCLGWSTRELMGRPFIEFVHPDDVEATQHESAKVGTRGAKVAEFENRYRAKDGSWHRLRWEARTDGHDWFARAYDLTFAEDA